MRILERYILSEFFKLLLIAVLSFIMLFIMVDLFENMDDLMKHKVPLFASIAFFIYKLPFIISQISPVAVLLSVLLALGILSKHGEITAMKAGGVRILRVLLPLMIFGLIASFGVILMNETLMPTALKKIDTFRKQWFGIQGSSFGESGMWVRTEAGIFNIRQVDLNTERLHGVTLYALDKSFKVSERLQSRLIEWKDEKWIAPSATVWAFTEGGLVEKSEEKDLTIEGLVRPEDLANVENFQKNMSFGELKNYIDGLEADGYDASRYKIDLYDKITFPLVNFVMVLVGIPFALKTGRYSGIAAGVGISIVIAFSYWIVFAVTKSLGQSGLITPLLAAVFPDVLFFAIGVLMYGYVRQ